MNTTGNECNCVYICTCDNYDDYDECDEDDGGDEGLGDDDYIEF